VLVMCTTPKEERLQLVPLAQRLVFAIFTFQYDSSQTPFPRNLRVFANDHIAQLDWTLAGGSWRHSVWGDSLSLGLNHSIPPTGSQLAIRFSPAMHQASNLFQQHVNDLFKLSSLPNDVIEFSESSDSVWRLGPKEVLCLENLLPWLRMLPCKSQRGLGQLLDPYLLLKSDYLAISLHLSISENKSIKVAQNLFVLLDLDYLESDPFSLFGLFQFKGIPKTCSFSSSVSIQPHELTRQFENIHFDLATAPQSSPTLKYNRYVLGHGKLQGGFLYVIQNSSPTASFKITLIDKFPYFLRVFFHSLQLDSSMSATIQSSFDCLNVSTEMPPSSRVRISIQFEKKLLPESEYPPDISRGFDLPNPILVVDEHQLFLDPAVVLLPSPDLSMPFNVIAITSTLFAFLFGNLYNALFRDAEMLAEEQNKVSERLNKILTRFRRSGTKEKAE